MLLQAWIWLDDLRKWDYAKYDKDHIPALWIITRISEGSFSYEELWTTPEEVEKLHKAFMESRNTSIDP